MTSISFVLAASCPFLIAIVILLLALKRKSNIIDHLQLELAETDRQLVQASGQLETFGKENKETLDRIGELEKKYSAIIDADAAVDERKKLIVDLKISFEQLNSKYQDAIVLYQSFLAEIDLYKETLDINSYGLYQPKYSFDLPEQFLVELQGVYDRQKEMIKQHTAVVCHTEWTVSGSKADGKRMINQASKLMLFAFNGECDALIAKVKWNNISKARERIAKSFAEINRLGSVNQIEVTAAFLELKNRELELTYEYEKKKHDQKEEQRLIRERMREEEKAQREFLVAQREAEEEAKLYEKVLQKARQELGLASEAEATKLTEKIRDLEHKLLAANERKERAKSRAEDFKSGNIYVISNIGSFGENIYKIGMTRRLDPMDRIKELSDAALPFQFDVHAIIQSTMHPSLNGNCIRSSLTGASIW